MPDSATMLADLLLTLMQDPKTHAPDLKGVEWLNTDRALESWKEDLRGQVVLLDFWTYCCINCLHVLPDLAALEREFADEPFLVIGVHSAKFEQESDPRNIRQAILRHHIEHPVVVDRGMSIWSQFGVRAWPTLVLVDAEGYVIGGVSGEGHGELLRLKIREVLDDGRDRGVLADGPLELERIPPPEGALRFPGKVHVHRDRLYVADSTGGRVLECDPASGAVLRAFAADPPWRNPQGMAGVGEALYVADTDNHLVRRVDLASGAVSTVAGTGEQARPLPRPGPAASAKLNSPWALEADGGLLHIAMAGSHQLWTLRLADGTLEPLAGSGRESIVDGEAARAALAQPSGLARIGRRLWFADSEVSALRFVELDEGEVGTVVGTGLFDFGDADGPAAEALLQHPLGVAAWGEQVLVADTFNGRIKRFDPRDRTLTTLELRLGGAPAELWEPGGIAVAGDTLFVADTNHHRVLRVDLTSGEAAVLVE
jgi:thiol-disulfide isomerase/thioredoxin